MKKYTNRLVFLFLLLFSVSILGTACAVGQNFVYGTPPEPTPPPAAQLIVDGKVIPGVTPIVHRSATSPSATCYVPMVGYMTAMGVTYSFVDNVLIMTKGSNTARVTLNTSQWTVNGSSPSFQIPHAFVEVGGVLYVPIHICQAFGYVYNTNSTAVSNGLAEIQSR